jgi:adenylate cyclase
MGCPCAAFLQVKEVLKSGSECLGGVRQKVTVLFSDIRDFTSISEAMDAADLVAMLNEYFGTQINPILENHGVLDKFIGDAIMATFGVPFSHGTDTRRACTTALQMIQQLAKFNTARAAQGYVQRQGPLVFDHC